MTNNELGLERTCAAASPESAAALVDVASRSLSSSTSTNIDGFLAASPPGDSPAAAADPFAPPAP